MSIMTAGMIDAQTAASFYLVNHVVEQEGLWNLHHPGYKKL
jgi:hypothetical protein